MRRLTVFDQRPLFEEVNSIFKIICGNQSNDFYLKWVYLERAIQTEKDVFSCQLDRLFSNEKVDPKLVTALAEINELYSTLHPRASSEIIAYIQNIVQKKIESIEMINASKLNEARAKSNQLDLEVKSDSSWRNPSLETPVRMHTPFSSGEDEESGKNLTK